MNIRLRKAGLLAAVALASTLGGCAGFDGFWNDLRGTPQYYTQHARPLEQLEAFPDSCLKGDVETPELAQCSAANPACYQLDNGLWCSGPGNSLCDQGEEQVPPGAQCPGDTGCWVDTPNLRCRSLSLNDK